MARRGRIAAGCPRRGGGARIGSSVALVSVRFFRLRSPCFSRPGSVCPSAGAASKRPHAPSQWPRAGRHAPGSSLAVASVVHRPRALAARPRPVPSARSAPCQLVSLGWRASALPVARSCSRRFPRSLPRAPGRPGFIQFCFALCWTAPSGRLERQPPTPLPPFRRPGARPAHSPPLGPDLKLFTLGVNETAPGAPPGPRRESGSACYPSFNSSRRARSTALSAMRLS